MAIPSRVGFATGANSGLGTVTPTYHAATSVGDLVIVAINATQTAAGFYTTPTGWTAIVPQTTLGTRSFAVFGKIFASADTGTVFNFASTAQATYGTATLRGTTTTLSSITKGSIGQRLSATPTITTAPGVATSITNSEVIGIFAEATTATETEAQVTVSGANKWFWDGGASGSDTNSLFFSYLDAPTLTTTASVTVTYPNTQTANGASVQLAIPPATASSTPPTANYTYSVSNKTLTFDGTSSAGTSSAIVSYAWTFGDGSTSTATNGTHAYTNYGTYTVALTVTDAQGLTATKSLSIAVTAPSNLSVATRVGWIAGTTGTATSTVAVPTGVTTGDLLLVGFMSSNLVNTFTAPDSTWTQIMPITAVGTRSMCLFVHNRLAGEASYPFLSDIATSTTWFCAALRGAAPAADVVIGPIGTRLSTGTSFSNTAPGMRVTSNQSTILTVSGEATTATETEGQITISGSTEWFWADPNDTTNGMYVGYSVQDAGTSPDVTVTYPNIQVNNGVAVQVAVLPDPTGNQTPTAAFSVTMDANTATVDGSGSADPDGLIATWAWNWGDGTTTAASASPTATHSYAVDGNYTITLSAADGFGATGTTSHAITAAYQGVAEQVWTGAALTRAKVQQWDGTTTIKPKSAIRQDSHHTTDWVAQMLAKTGFVVAHRGGSANWPEHSAWAFQQSWAAGADALEFSCGRSKDGVWFGLHDSTLDRTSGTTGFTASAHTWSEIQAYLCNPTSTDNQAQPARPYFKLTDALAAYPDAVWFVDPKYATSYLSEFWAILNAQPNSFNRFVVKSAGSSTSVGTAATAAGYRSWGYFYQSDYDSNNAVFDNSGTPWTYLGMEYGGTTAWPKILTYNKPVIAHIAPSAATYTTGMNAGAVGVMVSGIRSVLNYTQGKL